MKLVYYLTISFLLFVFITNLSIAFSSDDNEQVLDIMGQPVIEGNEYYILPSISLGSGTGLELRETRSNPNCPVTILQSNRSSYLGISVKFTNLENNSEKILTSTPLEIEVTKKPNCADSSKWIVFDDKDLYTGCVGIGGDGNYNNSKIIKGTFDILKHGHGYQFRFCIDGSLGDCYDIGISGFIGEGGKRLYLTRKYFKGAYEIIIVPNSFYSGIIKSVA